MLRLVKNAPLRALTGVEIVAIMGGDLIKKGAALGPRTEASLDEGAKVFFSLLEKEYNPYIVLSPGFAERDGHLAGREDQKHSLAAMMRMYLFKKGVPLSRIIITGDRVWGTRAEIGELEGVMQRFFDEDKFISKIHVVAAWWHLPRAAMIARKRYGRDLVAVYPSAAKLGPEVLLELRNLPAEWLRLRSPRFRRWLAKVRGRD